MKTLCFVCTTAVLLIAAQGVGADQQKEHPPVGGGIAALLETWGLGPAALQKFQDDREVDDSETQVILTLLLRLKSLDFLDFRQYAARPFDFDALANSSAADRGQLFQLAGDITQAEQVTLKPELAERFEMPSYWHCQMQLPGGQTATIYADEAPLRWQSAGSLQARAAVEGIYLKRMTTATGGWQPVLAARRVAWYPPTLLGNLKMDCGLFDTVADGRPIQERDREAFYALLAAVGRAEPGLLVREAEAALPSLPEAWRTSDDQGQPRYSVEPLFLDPKSQRGRLVVLSGVARQVERILIDDPALRRYLGIDHYWQVALYTDDSQGNPLIFCVRELPEGMPKSSGSGYGESVRIAGFFLKTWAYRIDIPRGVDNLGEPPGVRPQVAPLLMARDLTWYPRPEAAGNSWLAAVAIVIGCLAVLAAWIVGWRHRRHARRRWEIAHPREALDAEPPLHDIGTDSHAAPDFGGLKDIDTHKEENE